MVDVERARSRTFVVTGAASGIGLATAQRLLAEGGTVVGADLASPPDLGPDFQLRHGRHHRRSRHRRRHGRRARPPRRRLPRGRRRRRRSGPSAGPGRMGPRDRDQPHRHVSGGQGRVGQDDRARQGRRRAGLDRDRRQHRGPGRHRGWQLVQRRQGWCCVCSPRTLRSTTGRAASGQTSSAPASSTRRWPRASSACRGWRGRWPPSPRSMRCNGSAGRKKSRPWRPSCCRRRVVRQRSGHRRRRWLHRRPRSRRGSRSSAFPTDARLGFVHGRSSFS